MMTRVSPSSQKSDRGTTLKPTVDFTGTVPSHWAMMYVDEFGNVGEVSNLSAPFFDSHTRDSFAFKHSHTGHSSRAGQLKRRRTSFCEEPLNGETIEAFEAFEDPEGQVPLKIDNTKTAVTAFYTMAFLELQQINCRKLAKNMIKIIEPFKQVKHPYNGGRKPGGAPGEKGDPEDTKPDWWPRHVIHKEPDHMKKGDRVNLLVHLVQNLLPKGITVDSLETAVSDTMRHLEPANKAEEKAAILKEIIRVRKIEEQCLMENTGESTQTNVTDYDGARRGEDDPQSATSSPQMQQLEASQSPLDMASIPQYVSPLITTSRFQIPADLSFTNPVQRTPEFVSTQTEFGRHNLVNTPIAGPLLTPTHNHFIEPSQFADTSPTSHIHAASPAYTQARPPAGCTVSSPAFQQNIFSPVDYSNGAGHSIPPQVAYPLYSSYSSPQYVPQPFAVPELSRSWRLCHGKPAFPNLFESPTHCAPPQ